MRLVPFVLAATAAFAIAGPGAVVVAAEKGIAAGDLDRSTDPCTDFYAFANGAWRAANPIPAGAQSWSRRLAARERNRQQLVELLGELAAKADRPRGSIEQQLGDHFAACMDESAVDAAGLAPLAPVLAEIAAVRDVAGVGRMIRRLQELAVPAPFVLTGAFDYHDPENIVVNIAAGGLGMPDRDHYLGSEPRFVEAREKYLAHVAAVLVLGGLDAAPARTAAAGIVALETRLAEASLAPDAAGDPAATAHKVTFAQLATARFDWSRYFTEAGLPRAAVNVAEPAFLERLDRELDSTPVDVWKAYLTWHLLESASPWLSKPFAAESFAFKDQFLGGAKAMKPRATLCLESTEALLGEPLGRAYAARYFPPAAKAKAQEMMRGMLAVLREDIAKVAWMAPAMRQQALAKLASYDVKVGYPDAWTDYSALGVRRDAFWADVAAARRFGVDLDRRHVGQRIARSLWALPPSSPGAYIDVQLNLMVLPAGYLQSPVFDPAATDAANYGAIGVGAAHDFTHAIDALGADFDATGQPRKWWTEADRLAFEKAGQCVVDQFEGYAIEPGVHLRGKQVLGEAVGDLAGMRVAYGALQRSLHGRPGPVVDGFTPEQQFFISWGQFRGAAESLELQRKMLQGDTHPVARYRVVAPLANLPEFQEAFTCAPGTPMVRPAEQRCAVW